MLRLGYRPNRPDNSTEEVEETMSKGVSRIANCLISGLALVLAMSLSGHAAEGTVGSTIQTVNIPALCGTASGSAVAIVQGSKVGFPAIPILLVASCPTSTDGGPVIRLFFIEPGTPTEGISSSGTVVKTLDTPVAALPAAPTDGWRSLGLRADAGDLLACGVTATGGTVLYAIDISIFNNTPDGTATFLRNGPATSTCAGVTWDVSDKTIFQTSSGSVILHFPATGTATLAPIPSSCAVPNSSVAGLALAGPSLFVGCVPPPVIISSDSLSIKLAASREVQLAAWDGDDAFTDLVRSGDIVLATTPLTPPSEIHQINKTTGVLVRPAFGGPFAEVADLECDAASFGQSSSFGQSYKDAIWVKNQSFNTIKAVEIPAGTCSLSGTIPLLGSPGACPVHPVTGATYPKNPDGSPLDTDGDGLPDCWEDGSVWAAGSPYVLNPPDPAGQGRPGIDFDGDGVRDIVLCVGTECADKNVKDIFVEFDSMTGHSVPLDPLDPTKTQLTAVVTAFANAPVGAGGIRLHIQYDDQNVPHSFPSPLVNVNTAMPPCTPQPAAGDANFDNLKKLWFGTAAERGIANLIQREKTLSAKKLAFRYGLAVHTLTRDPVASASPSGCAEIPGNDFIVAIGSLGGPAIHKNGVSNQELWAGTFMHELGHTLGLRHGGGDNNNCKPNYLSVMSYTRQFKNLITDRPLDYSRQELPTLNKANLTEGNGIVGNPPVALQQAPGAPAAKTVHGSGPGSTAKTPSATGGINWNTPTDTTVDTSPTNVDVNQIGNVSGCDGAGAMLLGYDDWSHLVYNFRATVDFADGAHGSSDEAREITEPQILQLTRLVDADGDGVADESSCGSAACVIDIVPGVASNKVFLVNDQGVPTAFVPVALMSRPSLFDATSVDLHSLRFAGTPVELVNGQLACVRLDVNRDGWKDLVCLFEVTGLSPGEQTAILEGTTLGGHAIRAEGTMLVVKPQ